MEVREPRCLGPLVGLDLEIQNFVSQCHDFVNQCHAPSSDVISLLQMQNESAADRLALELLKRGVSGEFMKVREILAPLSTNPVLKEEVCKASLRTPQAAIDAASRAALDRAVPGLALDKSSNLARDKWLYEEYVRGTKLAVIVARLEKKTEWDVIRTEQGILAAVKRYAKCNGLPLPPSRQKREE